jgi:type I restriction enzyme S subunit
MRSYDTYKDSGVDWIESIPFEWNLKPFDKVLFENKNKYGSNDEHLDLLSLSGENGIYSKKYEDENQERNKEELENYNVVRKGQIVLNPLVNPLKLDYFGFSVSNIEGVVSPVYMVFETQNNSKYLEWFFKSHLTIQYLLSNTKGVRPLSLQLSRDSLKGIKIFLPPLSEQNQIVSYLDTKTSLIDSLIEKTQRKIELLKEKRTSLINEVVTKGLNPNVEMKDSGVEWIGEIPKGWGVKRLKNVSEVKPSNVDKHIFPDEIQVRLCNYTDVYYNDFISESTQLKSGSCNQMEFEKFRLEKGDVIITKDSESPDDIGIPCFVKDNFEDVVCGYHLTLIRPKNMDGGFIFRFIQSDKTRRYFEIHSNGITRFGLGKYSIENLFLPFPPLSEQNEIVSYLDEHTQLIDKTISVEERRIDTLKEYRQSLISEVVTGKRKVVN